MWGIPLSSSYTARVVMAMLGAGTAIIILTDRHGNHSHKVHLRDWQAPNGELYQLLDECPDIPDPEARYAVNMALLEFQEYQSPFENPGHAD